MKNISDQKYSNMTNLQNTNYLQLKYDSSQTLLNLQQRMFYNNQNLYNQNIYQNRYFSLPIHSHHKNKGKYQTPHKLSSTNYTKNDTLSFNTLLSKTKQTDLSKKTSTKKQKNISNKEFSKRKNSKSKSQSAYTKQSKVKNKSKTKVIKKSYKQTEQIQKDNIITNTQLFRKARGQSSESDTTYSFMRKISKVFDLVQQDKKLPLEMQAFLYKPLSNLREKFQKDNSKRVGESLINFKNDSMKIYRNAPNKDVVSFLRTNLPQNNRWQSHQKQKYSFHQNERQIRQKYFKSLKMKSHDQRPDDIFQLKRIEDRLDAFLERSLKNRKVYI